MHKPQPLQRRVAAFFSDMQSTAQFIMPALQLDCALRFLFGTMPRTQRLTASMSTLLCSRDMRKYEALCLVTQERIDFQDNKKRLPAKSQQVLRNVFIQTGILPRLYQECVEDPTERMTGLFHTAYTIAENIGLDLYAVAPGDISVCDLIKTQPAENLLSYVMTTILAESIYADVVGDTANAEKPNSTRVQFYGALIVAAENNKGVSTEFLRLVTQMAMPAIQDAAARGLGVPMQPPDAGSPNPG